MAGGSKAHQCVFAFLSDYSVLMTALIPHGDLEVPRRIAWRSLTALEVNMVASLDHAIWFHAPLDMNEWSLFVLTSPRAGSGRAFVRGTLFNAAGVHVASIAQEGVARTAHL